MSSLIHATRQDANYLAFLTALYYLSDQALAMLPRMSVGTTYITDTISDYKITIFLDKGRIYTDINYGIRWPDHHAPNFQKTVYVKISIYRDLHPLFCCVKYTLLVLSYMYI